MKQIGLPDGVDVQITSNAFSERIFHLRLIGAAGIKDVEPVGILNASDTDELVCDGGTGEVCVQNPDLVGDLGVTSRWVVVFGVYAVARRHLQKISTVGGLVHVDDVDVDLWLITKLS